MANQKAIIIEKLNKNQQDPLQYQPGTLAYHKTSARNKSRPKFKHHFVSNNRRIAIESPTASKNNLKRPLTNQNNVHLQSIIRPVGRPWSQCSSARN